MITIFPSTRGRMLEESLQQQLSTNMRLKDWINLWFGSQSLLRDRGLLWSVVAAGCFIAVSGCEPRNDAPRPRWAEEVYPDYDAVKSAYREIAFEVSNVTEKMNLQVSNFAGLAQEIRKQFPETQILLHGENPFPKILPKRSYGWLQAWENVSNMEDLPLIWTVVELREPTVLYVTMRGQIRAEKPNTFETLLNGYIARGVTLASTNNDHKFKQ